MQHFIPAWRVAGARHVPSLRFLPAPVSFAPLRDPVCPLPRSTPIPIPVPLHVPARRQAATGCQAGAGLPSHGPGRRDRRLPPLDRPSRRARGARLAKRDTRGTVCWHRHPCARLSPGKGWLLLLFPRREGDTFSRCCVSFAWSFRGRRGKLVVSHLEHPR